jgi:hypothetical protein
MRATRVFPWRSNNPRAAFWSFFSPTTRGVLFLPSSLRQRSLLFLLIDSGAAFCPSPYWGIGEDPEAQPAPTPAPPWETPPLSRRPLPL